MFVERSRHGRASRHAEFATTSRLSNAQPPPACRHRQFFMPTRTSLPPCRFFALQATAWAMGRPAPPISATISLRDHQRQKTSGRRRKNNKHISYRRKDVNIFRPEVSHWLVILNRRWQTQRKIHATLRHGVRAAEIAIALPVSCRPGGV